MDMTSKNRCRKLRPYNGQTGSDSGPEIGIWGEFRCQTSEGNFQLRTLWVVTLCSLRPTIALLRRGDRPTIQYDATGCPLRAETLPAALFEASSPIHEDRNGLS